MKQGFIMGRCVFGGVLLCCLCSFVFASSTQGIAHTDFSERVINFAIFLAILWYLGASKLQALLQHRKSAISERFEKAQKQCNDAKKEKEQAHKQLEEMRKKCDDMIATAQKEAIVIAQKYEEQCSRDIAHLIYSSESLMHFEQKKARDDIIESVLQQLFHGRAAHIDTQEYIRILRERVA